MLSKLAFTGGLVAAALLAEACGSASTGSTSAYGSSPAGSPSSGPAASPIASPSLKVANGTLIAVGQTRLGQILVDGEGKTLYLFASDTGPRSTCDGSCAMYWPPVLTAGAPQAGSGVNPSLLGTTTRQDGTTEVTYAGHPLYYFISDKKAGDVTGQGINGFGGPWYVVSPSGMGIV